MLSSLSAVLFEVMTSLRITPREETISVTLSEARAFLLPSQPSGKSTYCIRQPAAITAAHAASTGIRRLGLRRAR